MLNKTSHPEKQEAIKEDFSEPLEESSIKDSKIQEKPETASIEPPSELASGLEPDLKKKCQTLQDQLTRLAADFENYRKRVRDEQSSLIKYGAEKSVLELLPVLDNLERATKSLTEDSDPKTLFKSFSVINKQLMDGLSAIGAQKIQAVGKTFDPQLHEALNRMISADIPENTIMHEVQSGYQLYDKVIRPAQVIVSMGPSEEGAPVSDDNNPFLGQ